MTFNTAQLQLLKTEINGDPTLAAKATAGDYDGIATALNLAAVPDYWCWKTNVTKSQVTDEPSVDGTTFSWTAYIARSQGERDGWRELFSQGGVNPSLPQVRAAFADIFSGGTGNAQRTHLLAVARRKASRAEKVLATGTGSTGSPATFGFEGLISVYDIGAILAS